MFYVFTITPLVVIFFICLQSFNLKRKKKRFTQEWESRSFHTKSEDKQSISMYWQHKKEQQSAYDGIDELTWNDLDMDRVFEQLNYTQTSVGTEYLFNELRDIHLAVDVLEEKEQLYDMLSSDQRLRERILYVLSRLGKKDFTDSSALFYQEKPKLKGSLLYVFLSIFPLLSLLSMLYAFTLGISCFILAFTINIFVYYKNKQKLDHTLFTVSYILSIIDTGKRLSAIKETNFYSLAKQLKYACAPLRKLLFWNKIIALGKGTTDFEIIFEYIRILFLIDFISYNKIHRTIAKYRSQYKEVWTIIGQLDAAIAVVFFRYVHEEKYCLPTFTEDEVLSFEGMYHPLIQHPVKNHSKLTKSTLITGSNASGKSTYMKAVAINAILAQTIHTALADCWTMKPSYIVTSMAINDNVFNGDSYFIAEIKSLKRIISICESGKPVISFIDEILKGTNTVERIAASVSIMKWLSTKGGMNVIASHDLEMTYIMKDIYENYHFTEAIEDGSIHFDYTIHPGPATSKNAIQLLSLLSYPAAIIQEANNKADYFSKKKDWPQVLLRT